MRTNGSTWPAGPPCRTLRQSATRSPGTCRQRRLPKRSKPPMLGRHATRSTNPTRGYGPDRSGRVRDGRRPRLLGGLLVHRDLLMQLANLPSFFVIHAAEHTHLLASAGAAEPGAE